MRPSYRRAIEFIALNDDPTSQGGPSDGPCQPDVFVKPHLRGKGDAVQVKDYVTRP